MIDSILDSIKKALGLASDYTVFDDEIIMHINSALSDLYQIGGTPEAGVSIVDGVAKWSDFLVNPNQTNRIRTYIFLKVKLVFDPPSTGPATEAVERQIKEYESRINYDEILFNPQIYSFLDQKNGEAPTVWIIDDSGLFPPEAELGDVGYDPDTGNLWRNQ